MTSTGYPPGAAMPIQPAPDLSPADAVHIPRWLDELARVVAKAARPDAAAIRSACESTLGPLEMAHAAVDEAARRMLERGGGT